jgi:hypothetical protein
VRKKKERREKERDIWEALSIKKTHFTNAASSQRHCTVGQTDH